MEITEIKTTSLIKCENPLIPHTMIKDSYVVIECGLEKQTIPNDNPSDFLGITLSILVILCVLFLISMLLKARDEVIFDQYEETR